MKSVDVLLTFTCCFSVCSKQLKKFLTHQRRRNVQKSGTAHWQIPKARLGGPGWGAEGVEVRGAKGSEPRRRSPRRSEEWGGGFENGFQCFPSIIECLSLRCFSQIGVLSRRRFLIENNIILWLTCHNRVSSLRYVKIFTYHFGLT